MKQNIHSKGCRRSRPTCERINRSNAHAHDSITKHRPKCEHTQASFTDDSSGWPDRAEGSPEVRPDVLHSRAVAGKVDLRVNENKVIRRRFIYKEHIAEDKIPLCQLSSKRSEDKSHCGVLSSAKQRVSELQLPVRHKWLDHIRSYPRGGLSKRMMGIKSTVQRVNPTIGCAAQSRCCRQGRPTFEWKQSHSQTLHIRRAHRRGQNTIMQVFPLSA